MSTTQRDKHFQGYAKQQFDDVAGMFMKLAYALGSEEEAQLTNDIQLYLARRAYDFACHVASHVSESAGAMMETDMITLEEVVSEIPDLTELAKEGE